MVNKNEQREGEHRRMGWTSGGDYAAGFGEVANILVGKIGESGVEL